MISAAEHSHIFLIMSNTPPCSPTFSNSPAPEPATSVPSKGDYLIWFVRCLQAIVALIMFIKSTDIKKEGLDELSEAVADLDAYDMSYLLLPLTFISFGLTLALAYRQVNKHAYPMPSRIEFMIDGVFGVLFLITLRLTKSFDTKSCDAEASPEHLKSNIKCDSIASILALHCILLIAFALSIVLRLCILQKLEHQEKENSFLEDAALNIQETP